MNGYKTFAGILLSFIAFLGYGDIISQGDVAGLINSLTAVFGTALAIYGRIVARKTY